MDFLFDSNGSQSEIDDIDIQVEQLNTEDSSEDDLQEEEQSDDQLDIK